MIISICKICKTHNIFCFELDRKILSCYECHKWYDIKNTGYISISYKEVKNNFHKDNEIFDTYYDALMYRKKLRKIKKHSK